MVSKTSKELDIREFKDQDMSIWSANNKVNTRDDDWRPLVWLGTNDKFYFNRTSRDLKRIDICQVDINTNTVKVLVEERMNTYVETRKLGLVNDGQELIQWSERDGWGHFYLYDGNGKLKTKLHPALTIVKILLVLTKRKEFYSFLPTVGKQMKIPTTCIYTG